MEILKYAPLHNWNAYEEVLKSNPVIAKMMISGVVYSIGDWIGQVFKQFLFLKLMSPCSPDFVVLFNHRMQLCSERAALASNCHIA